MGNINEKSKITLTLAAAVLSAAVVVAVAVSVSDARTEVQIQNLKESSDAASVDQGKMREDIVHIREDVATIKGLLKRRD